jgi:hypothetical protein
VNCYLCAIPDSKANLFFAHGFYVCRDCAARWCHDALLAWESPPPPEPTEPSFLHQRHWASED